MTLDKLIKQLTDLSNKGYGSMEVAVLCCDDNPINGDGSLINGAYAVVGHPDKGVDGVYIDGTVS